MTGSVAVVVVGDLARSPRMLNHAREFAKLRPTVLVGFHERDFIVPDGVRVRALPSRTRTQSLAGSGLRMMRTFRDLMKVLLEEKPEVILVQNPPSFPTLLCASMAAARLGARLVVDWHNYGYSMLALRLGPTHPLVRAATWYEGVAGRKGHRHFCVSLAMQTDLENRFGIRAEVLYDRPVQFLYPPVRREDPRLVVICPAGWTADEDMELLLDVLELLRVEGIEFHLTGDGPRRGVLEPRIEALRRAGMEIHTGFLPEPEYRDLIARADVGISMHRSSSGLDLAMKVSDLFSAGVPVCAYDYGGSLPEQIRDGETGFLFLTAGELAAILSGIRRDGGALEQMRRQVRDAWNTTWAEEWLRIVQGPKKRILVAHPVLGASGGGNGVAAWALEALRKDYDVSLATLAPVDVRAVNRTFGTSLQESDFRLHVAPRRYRMLKQVWPFHGALLEICLTMRLARKLDREWPFDVLMGTQNEADFGRRGINYVHYPWVFLPRPRHEMQWFHYIPGFLRGYRLLCEWIAVSDNAGLRRNLALANSRFVAGRIRDVHGTDSVLLYPPVAGGFPDVPWDKRISGFVAVGRFHGCKRWELAVAIIDEVRRRGHEVTLTLIGNRDDPALFDRLAALASERPWFRLRTDVSREELAAEVARHRYGIHTMEEEHFGMAPAEIQRAGCIVFVHNSGGPVEIVGGDARLLFDGVADAAEKIAHVLSSPEEEASVRRHVAAQRGNFSEERFCVSLLEIVKAFQS